MTTTHDTTEADTGTRVRIVSRSQNTATTVSFNMGDKHEAGSTTGGDAEPSWTLTVERIRPAVPTLPPAVPTLPGAVVRLDGPDGPLAWLADPTDPDQPWLTEGGGWKATGAIAARITPDGVIFPGIEQ